MKTVNPIKVVLQFVAFVAVVAFLSSCSSQKHGYNYSSHAKKNKSVMAKAGKRNAGRDMVNYRCTNRH
jgi:hypothetical protein